MIPFVQLKNGVDPVLAEVPGDLTGTVLYRAEDLILRPRFSVTEGQVDRPGQLCGVTRQDVLFEARIPHRAGA